MEINNIAIPQSRSSEVFVAKHEQPVVTPEVALAEKKYTRKILGLNGIVIMATKNAASIKDIPLYRLVGEHYLAISITPSKKCKHSL